MILNDICEFIVDCPHSTAEDEGIGYPLIRTPNVGRGRLLLDDVHRVSKKVYEDRIKRGQPQKGDLILAREAPAGNVALIRDEEKVCLGQRTVLIRPNSDYVNPVWLTYYLLSPMQQWKLLGDANGATVAHVNLSVIRNLEVSIPSLEKQNNITTFIVKYDSLIENNNKQIALLEEAAERLYKEWFVKLHFPGHEHVRIVDGVPEGWKSGCVGDIAEFTRGKTITKDDVVEGDIPVIAGGLEPAYYHNVANTKAPVITVSGSGANAGFTQIQLNDVWASDCSFVDSDKTPYIYFLFCFLKSSARVLDNLKRGSAQPHVYATDLNCIELLIPKKSILSLFEQKVQPMFDLIGVLGQQTRLLQEARDRLLPKLMSGEIEV